MSIEQNKDDKEKRIAEAGRENTQDLIQKDLLLDFPENNKSEELVCECPNCHKTYEYYPEDVPEGIKTNITPEDPHPLGEEGWCYTCVFGEDE